MAQSKAALTSAEESEQELRRVISILESVERDFPSNNQWQENYLFAVHRLGDELVLRGRSEQAAEQYWTVIERGEEFHERFPSEPRYPQTMAEAMVALTRTGTIFDDEKLDIAYRAFDLASPLLEEYPADAMLRGTAYRCFDCLVRILIDHGDPYSVMMACEDYESLDPYKCQSQLTLAEAYLACHDLYLDDSTLEPAARQTLALDARDRAINAVVKAAAHRPGQNGGGDHKASVCRDRFRLENSSDS